MIIRIFKASIHPDNHDLWQQKVEKFSIPWIRSQPGLVAYYPGKPLEPDSGVFTMTSVWETMESMVNAVGEDYRQVVLLEDEATLVEDASVEHFEFFDAE